MTKKTSGSESSASGVPDRPGTSPPRDLYATSDIRFVTLEVGKLQANVERLISDVKDQSTKLDKINHALSFLKGAAWTMGLALTAIGFVLYFFFGPKFTAILDAIQRLPSK